MSDRAVHPVHAQDVPTLQVRALAVHASSRDWVRLAAPGNQLRDETRVAVGDDRDVWLQQAVYANGGGGCWVIGARWWTHPNFRGAVGHVVEDGVQ